MHFVGLFLPVTVLMMEQHASLPPPAVDMVTHSIASPGPPLKEPIWSSVAKFVGTELGALHGRGMRGMAREPAPQKTFLVEVLGCQALGAEGVTTGRDILLMPSGYPPPRGGQP